MAGNIFDAIGKAGELWTYGPMALREEKRQQDEAEANRKYKEALAQRTQDFTPAQKAELMQAMLTARDKRNIDEEDFNFYMKSFGLPVPPARTETPAPTQPQVQSGWQKVMGALPQIESSWLGTPPAQPKPQGPGFFGRVGQLGRKIADSPLSWGSPVGLGQQAIRSAIKPIARPAGQVARPQGALSALTPPPMTGLAPNLMPFDITELAKNLDDESKQQLEAIIREGDPQKMKVAYDRLKAQYGALR